MTSFPHNLVLNSQPCFGLTPSEFFKPLFISFRLADFHETCCKLFTFCWSFLSSTCKSLQSFSFKRTFFIADRSSAECYYTSHVMRKPAFCICKNKGNDQLCSNRAAHQCLRYRYLDSKPCLLYEPHPDLGFPTRSKNLYSIYELACCCMR